jgi:hypothetical protein
LGTWGVASVAVGRHEQTSRLSLRLASWDTLLRGWLRGSLQLLLPSATRPLGPGGIVLRVEFSLEPWKTCISSHSGERHRLESTQFRTKVNKHTVILAGDVAAFRFLDRITVSQHDQGTLLAVHVETWAPT